MIKIHIEKHRQFSLHKGNHGKALSELVLMDTFKVMQMFIYNLDSRMCLSSLPF